MTTIRQQSTIAKPHLHSNVKSSGHKGRQKKIEEKGNDALLEELSQLHKRNALPPMKKEDMTYGEKSIEISYVLKEKEMGALKQEDVQMAEANVSTPPRQTLVHPPCHSRP